MTDPVYQAGTPFAAAVDAVRGGKQDPDEAASGLIAQLTDLELLGLLDGDVPVGRGMREMMKRYNGVPIEAGRLDRLGIPGIRFTDGPRGVVVRNSTCFPVAIARGASWDPDLERSVGEAIGKEARAQGANLFAGVCINLPPFPGWGRSQESYGEDPLLTGSMGAALSQGAQPWVMTTVKHYACNSMDEARFTVDVRVEEDVLHEVYLPHFRTVVESGVDAVMSSYNSVNGEWAGQNRRLLTGILREEWGFAGFVMTDFIWGLRDPIGSVAAGQDLEMPFAQQRAKALPEALADGRLPRGAAELAARRLLATQIRLALRAQPTPPQEVIASPEHRELSREAARRGSVLLRNETVDGLPVLPLAYSWEPSVAVLGRLAGQPNMGDHGSSQTFPPSSVSILDGLRERLGERVVHGNAWRLGKAVEAARTADVAVVVVGPAEPEGEALVADAASFRLNGGWQSSRIGGWLAATLYNLKARFGDREGDRRNLGVSAEDAELVRAVASVNRRTIVVVVGGGTMVVDPWDRDVAALLLAWFPGMEGGRAVADLLLGDAEPSGRLPLAIPRRKQDLPTVDWRARSVRYDRWLGQRKLDRDGIEAAYPFGFGLGYTTFAVSDLSLGRVKGERFTATVSVRNTGQRAGRHVVQVYAHLPGEDRPVRALVGFRAVQLAAGKKASVKVDCSTRPLQRWTPRGYAVEVPSVRVEAGSWSGDPKAVKAILSGLE
jgi:beta-glucosidase